MASDQTTNPLLHTQDLPLFHEIRPEHVVPGIRRVLDDLRRRFEDIEAHHTPDWDDLVERLENLDYPLEYAWGPVNHLLNVKNSEALRSAHREVLQDVVALGIRMRQSPEVYKGLEAIRESPAWASFDEARRRLIEHRLLSARQAGVALEGEARERFTAIEQELSQLSTDVSNRVLDATKAFELIVEDLADTEGWPDSLKRLAAQSYAFAHPSEAEPDAEAGPWRITLDYPSYVPFMQHSRRRDQRETLYRAFVTRASSGELDNTPAIERILELRREKAELLGYDSYVAFSLDTKMAPDVEAVATMIDELYEAARPFADLEYEQLKAFAAEHGQSEPLVHWDLAFWSERLREHLFGFTDEELRPYFPLPRVLDGLFGLCNRLFGITVEEVEDEPTIWHPDVRFYRVRDEAGDPIASFYLDPYTRPQEKRGGAWMDNCLDRRRLDDTTRLPVVHLCCNGTPPVGNRPSLMSFREVETLFHEFGHGLQGMLTKVDVTGVAGINGVEWDAVELASQFMENWCYHKPTLIGMTRHVDTGEPLPDDLFDKITAARTFQSGMMMLRQLLFAKTDLDLHYTHTADVGETALDVYRRNAEAMSILPPLPEDRFLCAFTHIFAGGYAAGYYSYKWAEVLSADAFAAFEEVGLDNDEAVHTLGRRYRDTVLALGGSRHPMDVFRDFRGREPSTDALLRHSGLVPELLARP